MVNENTKMISWKCPKCGKTFKLTAKDDRSAVRITCSKCWSGMEREESNKLKEIKKNV